MRLILSLVNYQASLIGNNLYVVALLIGKIPKTKIQVSSEENYRLVATYISRIKKNDYIYQLKSSRELVVVFKGIEPNVNAEEIKEAL